MDNGSRPSSWPIALLRVMALVGVLAVMACFPSSEVDPRCTIEADGRHHDKLAQTINGSKLWQTYFDVIDPTATRKLADIQFTVDRARHRSVGGDYDPGKITVVFKATNLTKRQNLYTRSEEVDLEPFMIGFFDKNATRDEVQEIAFKAMEDRIYPYLATWVDIAAIRAMGQEGSGGYEFETLLQKLLDDRWSNLEIQTAARNALAKIRG
jgi:hypothetical protein